MMKLHASGEDYLEAILILQRQMGESTVRSIDLARHMGFSKPSISHAVGVLQDGGFLEMDKDGFLHLTDKGREVAEKIYERHQFFTEQLIAVGVHGMFCAPLITDAVILIVVVWMVCSEFKRVGSENKVLLLKWNAWAAYLRRCPDLFQNEDFYKEQKNRGKKHKNNPMSIDNGKNLD